MPEEVAKASEPLFEQLSKSLEKQGSALVSTIKGVVVFDIDGTLWTLDLRAGNGSLKKGPPEDDEKADLKLTMTDANFVKLVHKQLNPQAAFLMRKLRISGSMALALKLQPILDAAAPTAKL